MNMKPDTQRLLSAWRDQAEDFIDRFTDDVMEHGGPSYAAMPREQFRGGVKLTVEAWLATLEAKDSAPLIEHARKMGVQRAASQVDISATMYVMDVLRKQIWQLMSQVYAAGDWDMDLVEQVERWLHEQRKAVVSGFSQVMHEAQEHLNEREEALAAQRRLIQELSAPIVPIHKGVLVLPLVGTIDSRRASQIMESALEKIVAYQADVLILDITGVPLVDTGVANYILQMARAVTLLGSKVVLVGIGAEIAQTIVQLGVELHDMTTLANLQAGIAFALAEQGFAIRPIGAAGRDVNAA
jgi:rsbT co-antagonist protein RsbR